MGFFKLFQLDMEMGHFREKGQKAERGKKRGEAKYFCEIFSTWIKVGKQLDFLACP